MKWHNYFSLGDLKSSRIEKVKKETAGQALALAVKNLVDSGVSNIEITVDNYVVKITKTDK